MYIFVKIRVFTSYDEYKIRSNMASEKIARKAVVEHLNKDNAKEFFRTRQ